MYEDRCTLESEGVRNLDSMYTRLRGLADRNSDYSRKLHSHLRIKSEEN